MGQVVIPRVGLSVRQPWAACLVRGLTPVVNRGGRLLESAVGERIAIHASLGLDPAEVEACRRACGLAGVALPVGALPQGAVVAVATEAGCVEHSPSPLFEGPWGWLLKDVVPVAPIPCRGALGLWSLPDAVREALGEALARGDGGAGVLSFEF